MFLDCFRIFLKLSILVYKPYSIRSVKYMYYLLGGKINPIIDMEKATMRIMGITLTFISIESWNGDLFREFHS